MPTNRQPPAGVKPEDGFSTKYAFENDPDIAFWEKTVKPPGLDGGEAIDTTTMHNVQVRTFAPRSLVTLTPMTSRVTYDPRVYPQIIALINEPQEITVHFPNGDTLVFVGYLRVFNPADNSEGAQPEADIEIQPTNTDPDDGDEVLPVLTEAAGTSA